MSTNPKFIVMCRVTGGVTGTREAPLKREGKIRVFSSREVAEKLASSLMQAANNPHRTADFSYWTEKKEHSWYATL
ncbi:hypothetical protein LCGC14_1562540 [marine sediment metagenome]|uniref:Uncharacterized protein n=2 Tax=marine sediment metagenome TaxID=412755 RepID=A0A0F9J878_9ZZZZ